MTLSFICFADNCERIRTRGRKPRSLHHVKMQLHNGENTKAATIQKYKFCLHIWYQKGQMLHKDNWRLSKYIVHLLAAKFRNSYPELFFFILIYLSIYFFFIFCFFPGSYLVLCCFNYVLENKKQMENDLLVKCENTFDAQAR